MGQFDTFDDVLGVLRRRMALILGMTLIGAMLSIFYSGTLPKLYETSATIQIELPVIAGATPGSTNGSRAKNRMNLIKQRLMARGNLLEIINELGLFESTGLSDQEKVEGLRQAVTIDKIVDPADAWRPDAVPSGLLIQVRLGNPENAALTANTFLDRILLQSEERRHVQASQTLSFFENEAVRIDSKMNQIESEIADFKQEHADAMPAGIASLRTQLASLRETELEIVRQIIGLKTNSSRVREDVLTRQIAELEGQNELVGERIQGIENSLAAAPQVERDFSRLSRELDQLQEQLTVITRRRAEAEMSSMMESTQQTERFEVLEAALVPQYPVSPSRKKITIAGTMLFMMLGAGIAVLLELLNPAIRTAAQMERALGINPIVEIPVIEGEKQMSKGRMAKIAALLLGLAIIAIPIIRRGFDMIGAALKSRRQAKNRLAAR